MTRQRSRVPRRGLATLEVALCLPVLAGLMAIIFTLASAGMTKSETSIEARYEAWQRREDRRAATRLPLSLPTDGEVGRVLGFTAIGPIPPSSGTLPPEAGLIVEQRRNPVPTAYPGYRGSNLTAVETHRVLAGTWDFREVRFPERGRLVPDPRFAYFAPPVIPGLGDAGNLISSLNSFSGLSGSGGSNPLSDPGRTFDVGDSDYDIGGLAQTIAGIGGSGNSGSDIVSNLMSPGSIVDVATTFGVDLLDLAKSVPGVGELLDAAGTVVDAIGDGIDAIGDAIGSIF